MPSGKEPEREYDSFSERIIASASTLAHSTLSQPPTNREVPASGLLPEDKPGPSSTTVSSSERTSHHLPMESNARPQHPSIGSPPESFRSDLLSPEIRHNAQVTQKAFDEFKASSQRGLETIMDPLTEPQSPPRQSAEKGKDHQVVENIMNDAVMSKSSSSIPYASPAEDGAAVVDLLSDPSFVLDENFGDYADIRQTGDLEILDARNNDANKVKDVREQVHFSDRDLSAEFQETWKRIFTGYQDEVWGDKSPAAEEARTEVWRELQAGIKQPGNGTAVNRLRMLLGHMPSPSIG